MHGNLCGHTCSGLKDKGQKQDMKSQYLECGKLVNTHGVMGNVKAESWCDSPRVLASLKTLYLRERGDFLPLKVEKASVFRDFVIFSFENVQNMDAAEKLKGKIIYADRDDLMIPEGSFFIADLIGLDVIDADTGKKYGTLKDVLQQGMNELYVVSTPGGDRMVPNVPAFIHHTVAEGDGSGVFVTPIPGLLEGD